MMATSVCNLSSPISSPPAAQKNYDLLYKILIIGNSGVGKSCLLLRFTDNVFRENYISTIGVDFKVKTIQQDDRVVKLQIWDTAGQERFRSIANSYYRGSNAIFIVFDVTDPNSLEDVKRWLCDARALVQDSAPVMVIGNKVDLKKRRRVSQEEAKSFCVENNISYLEASAKTGQGVEKAFQTIVSQLLDKRMEGAAEHAFVHTKDFKPINSKCFHSGICLK